MEFGLTPLIATNEKTFRDRGFGFNMICIKADIPKELNDIDDELKAIYHSKDTVCFYIFKTRDLRNEFVEKTKGMEKTQREEIYKQYLI